MLPPGSRGSRIKPPRKSLTASASTGNQPFDYAKSWEVLSNAIIQIQNKNVSNLSYEQLYRKAYTLVLHKYGNKLYEDVSDLIKTHLLSKRLSLLAIFNESYMNVEEEFMKAVIKEWNEHLQAMKFISDVLMYLNRVYVKEQNKLLIYDLGIKLFKEYIIKYMDNMVGDKIIQILVSEIQRNRDGEIISTKMYITKIIEMFEMLHEDSGLNDLNVVENYYQKYFEPTFLSSSEAYYNGLIGKFLNYESALKYLVETSQFLAAEADRITFYLPASTVPKLIDSMNNILIKSQLDNIMNFPSDGLYYWIEPIKHRIISSNGELVLDSNQLTFLRILYDLNRRIDENCDLLKMRLKDIIVKEGKQFPLLIKTHLASLETESGKSSGKKATSLSSPSFANKWINTILEYQLQFGILVKDAFDHDYSMEQFIVSAIQEFINISSKNKKALKDPNTLIVNPSELLSVYMDYNIKQFIKPTSIKDKEKAINGSSLNSADEFIDRSIQFLRFIADKDAFEAYYKNHFAKRFLNSKGFNQGSVGFDIEELIITRLSEEMGTTSMDSIIKMNLDIKQSKEITSEWKQFTIEQNDKTVSDMDLKICNVSYWPTSMTKDYKAVSGKSGETEGGFIWPRHIKHNIQRFEQFWGLNKKNDNKSLYWCPKFGSMDLRITYPSKTYEINLPTYAGVIMLLFGPSHSLDTTPDPSFNPFQTKKKLTYKEIEELTGIPEQELKRHLQSIAVASRLRLLTKTPMSKDVNDNDLFELNEKFKSPSPKVKILTVSASASSAASKSMKSQDDLEQEEIESNINEGRKHEINAAIVRILKSRQSIGHTDLVTEVIRQLQNRFSPNNSLIKSHLEDLIDKEYLKRDDNNRNLYHYIA